MARLYLAPPSHSRQSITFCDWKGRAASAQSFTLWQQATIKIPRRAHLISTSLRHMGVVVHAHLVRGVSHIHRKAK